MLPRSLLVCMLLLCAYSCVKDTDFDQADEITATPEIELDLIYFTATPPQFELEGETERALTISDTTDIRILDDNFIRDALKRAEFYFLFSNSIPTSFDANIQFLNANNRLRYQLNLEVLPGELNTPVLTERIEILETPADIRDITRSSKVVINLSIPDLPPTSEGSISLQSKATYFLEY